MYISTSLLDVLAWLFQSNRGFLFLSVGFSLPGRTDGREFLPQLLLPGRSIAAAAAAITRNLLIRGPGKPAENHGIWQISIYLIKSLPNFLHTQTAAPD